MLSFALLSHFSVQDMVNNELKSFLCVEAIEAGKIGKLTNKQLAIIYENRWFHLLVSRAYGGEGMY